MTFLLDVNALVALGLLQHEFHERVAKWVSSLAAHRAADLATCSITELGFVRVLSQATQYGFTISQVRGVLERLKKAENPRFSFIIDDHSAARLPGWVKAPKQITDGHLVKLAKAHGAELATLDRGIVGAFLIPPA